MHSDPATAPQSPPDLDTLCDWCAELFGLHPAQLAPELDLHTDCGLTPFDVATLAEDAALRAGLRPIPQHQVARVRTIAQLHAALARPEAPPTPPAAPPPRVLPALEARVLGTAAPAPPRPDPILAPRLQQLRLRAGRFAQRTRHPRGTLLLLADYAEEAAIAARVGDDIAIAAAWTEAAERLRHDANAHPADPAAEPAA